MTIAKPTLPELIDQAVSEIEASLPGANPRPRRSVLGVLARVVAGAAHGLYGYIDWVAQQFLPDTATDEYLERHANLRGLYRLPAAVAAGWIMVEGDNDIRIPADTQWRRTDGTLYVSTREAIIANGNATIFLEALTPGQAGNIPASVTLTLASPIFGLTSGALTVGEGMTGGRDAESDASLRARLLNMWWRPPQGGSTQDYISWVQETIGDGRVWVMPEWTGPGSVGVTFLNANNDIPSAYDVAQVQAHLETRRPVTAKVVVFAPTPLPINPVIRVTPNTDAVKNAALLELNDFIRRDAVPGGKIFLSRLREAVSIAVGEFDHTVVTPSADIPVPAGSIAVLGTVSWVA